MRCRVAKRAIDAAFVEGEPRPDLRALWTHLRRCPGCRGHYDLVMSAERILEAGSVVRPAPLELSLVAASLPRPTAAGRWAGIRALLVAPRVAAPALVALLVVVGISTWWQLSGEDEWLVRDSERPAVAIRCLCKMRDVTGESMIRSLSDDPTTQEVDGCPEDGVVLFAHLSDVSGYLAILHERPDGTRGWIAPERGGPLLRVEPAVQLKSLAARVGPEVLASVDELVLVFVWSDEPMVAERVEELAAGTGSTDDGWVWRRHIPIGRGDR